MSEPSVEDIVAEYEKYSDMDNISVAEVRLLIADWRKRGEALAQHERDKRLFHTLRGIQEARKAHAALTTQQPPPPSTP